MPEDARVRSDRHLEVTDRSLANFLSVDPDLCPRHRIQSKPLLGQLDLDGCDLSWRDLNGTDRLIHERDVGYLDFMLARRHHDALGRAAAQQTAALVDLHLYRSRDRDPTRSGPG